MAQTSARFVGIITLATPQAAQVRAKMIERYIGFDAITGAFRPHPAVHPRVSRHILHLEGTPRAERRLHAHGAPNDESHRDLPECVIHPSDSRNFSITYTLAPSRCGSERQRPGRGSSTDPRHA